MTIENLLTLSEATTEGYRNDSERIFLNVLSAHAPEWKQFCITDDDSWVSLNDDSVLAIAFDMSYGGQSNVLRSVRIDFTGISILVCDLGRGSNLFDSQLNANGLDVKELLVADNSPKALADLAAEWLSQEFSKKESQSPTLFETLKKWLKNVA